jgi:hypothetical protein
MSEKFWLDDPVVLSNNLDKFFPKKTRTQNENLNALMRLVIYASVLSSIYYKSYTPLGLILIAAVITVLVKRSKVDLEKFLGELAPFTPLQKPKKTEVCVKPTIDNPFMNPTSLESTFRDVPPCDLTEPEIKREADNYYSNNLFRDTSDLFGKLSSQRQYYSIPNHDTITFANWLYKNDDICKVNNDFCLRYEDVRANRRD